MAILVKAIYRFNTISNVIFHRNTKINSKIHMEAQNTPNNQSNLEQKKKRAMLEIPQYLTSDFTIKP
jgi:hypothetical protein